MGQLKRARWRGTRRRPHPQHTRSHDSPRVRRALTWRGTRRRPHPQKTHTCSHDSPRLKTRDARIPRHSHPLLRTRPALRDTPMAMVLAHTRLSLIPLAQVAPPRSAPQRSRRARWHDTPPPAALRVGTRCRSSGMWCRKHHQRLLVRTMVRRSPTSASTTGFSSTPTASTPPACTSMPTAVTMTKPPRGLK